MQATVLVVDDTPDNLTLMSGLLKDQYRVKVANGGERALKIAGSDSPPDLILLDIMMPEVDGYEVCRRLKENPETRDIPIIFLTAKSEVEDEARGLALGAVDYITKPISPPIVLARVKTHLELKQAADFLRDQNAYLEAEVRRRTEEAKAAERIRAQVGQFFSPTMRGLLDVQGTAGLLAPVRRNVSVLHFDLRGFSRATERAEGEALASVLEHYGHLTEVMTLATSSIFAHEGIVLDFAGDSILAGWGAPAEQPDHAQRAVQAAIEIVARVQAVPLPFSSPGGLQCGIGLSCGDVVAGQLGGRDQIKYGWMGRVVNQAARLEGLTKYFGVPILLTGPCRERLGHRSDIRRIGKVRPAGMDEAVEIHEVVVAREMGGSGLSPDQIAHYEAAEESYSRGDLLTAVQELRQMPVEDPVAKFLIQQALRYQECGIPPKWNGWFEFSQK
jgi:CheY-like chemotaxis protein/class 3 adenylate cyclase